jgi:hypothetical protein
VLKKISRGYIIGGMVVKFLHSIKNYYFFFPILFNGRETYIGPMGNTGRAALHL